MSPIEVGYITGGVEKSSRRSSISTASNVVLMEEQMMESRHNTGERHASEEKKERGIPANEGQGGM